MQPSDIAQRLSEAQKRALEAGVGHKRLPQPVNDLCAMGLMQAWPRPMGWAFGLTDLGLAVRASLMEMKNG